MVYRLLLWCKKYVQKHKMRLTLMFLPFKRLGFYVRIFVEVNESLYKTLQGYACHYAHIYLGFWKESYRTLTNNRYINCNFATVKGAFDGHNSVLPSDMIVESVRPEIITVKSQKRVLFMLLFFRTALWHHNQMMSCNCHCTIDDPQQLIIN